MNREILKPYIEERLISEQKHPTVNLWIYNYTKKTQYDQKWDEITMMCRGLILDSHGNVIARPFRKFFNYGEWAEGQREGEVTPEFEVYEKYDGSLGILYWVNNEPRIATRGSFTSEQAFKGTELLWKKYKKYPFKREYTYLFEILYPGNRIVLNYGDKEDLILLAVIETETGRELPLDGFREFNVAKRYDGIKDISELTKNQEPNREGYVIRFSSGLRLKVKFDEYVRLHRIITETNTKTVWEHLKDNKSPEDLLEKVPDEFYNWVKRTILDLQAAYYNIEAEAEFEWGRIKGLPRKEFAAVAVKSPLKPILFNMEDGQDYSNFIWMMVKPKAEKPFKEEI